MAETSSYIDNEFNDTRCRLELLHGKLRRAIREHIKVDTQPSCDEIHYYKVLQKGFVLSEQDVSDLVEFMEMFLYD